MLSSTVSSRALLAIAIAGTLSRAGIEKRLG